MCLYPAPQPGFLAPKPIPSRFVSTKDIRNHATELVILDIDGLIEFSPTPFLRITCSPPKQNPYSTRNVIYNPNTHRSMSVTIAVSTRIISRLFTGCAIAELLHGVVLTAV